MSHPDPLYDEENTMSYDNFDDMAERTIWLALNWDRYTDDDFFDDYDDSMDGDHDSAMESAGWGTDEDYGYYGEDY